MAFLENVFIRICVLSLKDKNAFVSSLDAVKDKFILLPGNAVMFPLSFWICSGSFEYAGGIIFISKFVTTGRLITLIL